MVLSSEKLTQLSASEEPEMRRLCDGRSRREKLHMVSGPATEDNSLSPQTSSCSSGKLFLSLQGRVEMPPSPRLLPAVARTTWATRTCVLCHFQQTVSSCVITSHVSHDVKQCTCWWTFMCLFPRKDYKLPEGGTVSACCSRLCPVPSAEPGIWRPSPQLVEYMNK